MLLLILRHAILPIFQNFDGKGYFSKCSKTAIFLFFLAFLIFLNSFWVLNPMANMDTRFKNKQNQNFSKNMKKN